MRLALISDVHGNTPALRAVLADAAGRDVDLIVNLGDIASGGLDPTGTVAALRGSNIPAVHVRGNHERQLLTLPVARMSASDRLAHGRLSADDKAWLARLPVTAQPVPGMLAFHGTPDVDTQYLLHTVTSDGLREATALEIRTRLGAHASRHQVFLCGHTHLQGACELPGDVQIVNPGSVGWPAYDDDEPYPHVVEPGTPHARYTVLARGEDASKWEVTPVALDYDIEYAAALASANDPRCDHSLEAVNAGQAGTATSRTRWSRRPRGSRSAVSGPRRWRPG